MYLQKLKKTSFQTLFYIFINNSRSEQNKKHPEHPFVDIGKLKTCARFQLKILSSLVVEARQSFHFFRQITWLVENNIAWSKFRYRILHYLIAVIKLWKNQSTKAKFISIMWAWSCLNTFHVIGLFLYLFKTSENQWCSDVFRGLERNHGYEMA